MQTPQMRNMLCLYRTRTGHAAPISKTLDVTPTAFCRLLELTDSVINQEGNFPGCDHRPGRKTAA